MLKTPREEHWSPSAPGRGQLRYTHHQTAERHRATDNECDDPDMGRCTIQALLSNYKTSQHVVGPPCNRISLP